MNEQPEVKAGQVWCEADPRFERKILVLVVSAKFGVLIRNIKTQPGSQGRWAKRERFNGKRGGYAFVSEGA